MSPKTTNNNNLPTWATNWLQQQRNNGQKCIEIKQNHNALYIYKSTTYWDKQTKKRKKHSTYQGKLDQHKGLIPSKTPYKTKTTPKTLHHYGDAMLLHHALKPLKTTLQAAFPDTWQEIYAIALVRITGNTPLKRINTHWQKYHNPQNLTPNLDPKHLSTILRTIGADKKGQNAVFSQLLNKDKDHCAYDLSVIFTRSTMAIAELGYNSQKRCIPQVNIVLLTSVTRHLPVMLRVVPGSVRDVSTVKASIAELGFSNIVLILDRGLFSDENIGAIVGSGSDVVVAARRNSRLYGYMPAVLGEHFFLSFLSC